MRYTTIVGIGECAYRGVKRVGEPDYSCKRILTPHDRLFIEDSLALAQDKLEQVLGFPLAPRWVHYDMAKWNRAGIARLKWGCVQTIGERVTANVSLGAGLTLRTGGVINDPVTLVVGTIATNPCEIRVNHTVANAGSPIEPSDISISGGNATILIPRCRLVDQTIDQPSGGYEYTDDANFVTSVDVVQEYPDPGTGSEIVWDPTNLACLPACEEYAQDACPTITNSDLGLVRVRPAVYSSGSWSMGSYAKQYAPDKFRLSYLAYYNDPTVSEWPGCSEIPLALERAMIRLAHCEMPRQFCMCEWHKRMWEEDRTILDGLPIELTLNPFGPMQGQIYAWKTATLYAQGRGGAW